MHIYSCRKKQRKCPVDYFIHLYRHPLSPVINETSMVTTAESKRMKHIEDDRWTRWEADQPCPTSLLRSLRTHKLGRTTVWLWDIDQFVRDWTMGQFKENPPVFIISFLGQASPRMSTTFYAYFRCFHEKIAPENVYPPIRWHEFQMQGRRKRSFNTKSQLILVLSIRM